MKKKDTIALICSSCEHQIFSESADTELQIVCSACGADVSFDSTAQKKTLTAPLPEIENEINMQGSLTMPPPPQPKVTLPPPPPQPRVSLPPPPPPVQTPPLVEMKKTSPITATNNTKLSPTAESIQTSCISVTRCKISRRLVYAVLGLLFLVGISAGGYFVWMKIDKNNRDTIVTKNSQLVKSHYNILQERNKKKEQLAEKEKEARLTQEQEILRKKAEDLASNSSETEKKVVDIKALLKIEKTSLLGQWRQETRSYIETITFNPDGTYVSVLEYTRGPPADTSAEFSGSWKIDGDELVQTRNENTSRAKIRMTTPTSFEEPSEDQNWPRIWTKVAPGEIKNDTSTGDQGRVVESFVTTITNNDIRNSNGVQILDPVLILMQDRANVHRFGNLDGDNVDQFFNLAENRAKIRSFLERGSFPQDIQQSILSGNGVKLRIRVYSNDEGKNCVDVSYEGAQGGATSDFSPDQKIMAFIDSESNFRMEPSVNSAVKFQPKKGTTGLVLERRDKWVKIELKNGDTGWAHESNLGKAVKSQDFVEPE